MKSVVRFRTDDGEYAVPVEHAREVLASVGLTPLPAPRRGVAGLLEREGVAITVLTALGGGREHVLVLDAGNRPFGLLVEEVTGVDPVNEAMVAPPPAGQEDPVISGVLDTGKGGIVLLVDVANLAGRLDS